MQGVAYVGYDPGSVLSLAKFWSYGYNSKGIIKYSLDLGCRGSHEREAVPTQARGTVFEHN